MLRRFFLKKTTLFAFATSVSGFTQVNAKGQLLGGCPTTSDALGPYFREGAPIRNDLNYKKRKGKPLKVIGQLFASDCETPIANTIIEVWHCTHRRRYDMKSPHFKCRAKVQTDENGFYFFNTIIPPNYWWRPKHIHFLVRDIPEHAQLITQLYFKGDKRIKKRTEHNHYPYDKNRILTPYQNVEGQTEVQLNLYLSPLPKE